MRQYSSNDEPEATGRSNFVKREHKRKLPSYSINSQVRKINKDIHRNNKDIHRNNKKSLGLYSGSDSQTLMIKSHQLLMINL